MGIGLWDSLCLSPSPVSPPKKEGLPERILPLWMDDTSKLNQDGLPDIGSFYSKSSQISITNESVVIENVIHGGSLCLSEVLPDPSAHKTDPTFTVTS